MYICGFDNLFHNNLPRTLRKLLIMSSKDFKQEMPPPGGYRNFNFSRTYAKQLFRPGLVSGIIAGCTLYGIYQSYMIRKHIVTEKFEDVDIQNAMEPFLVAERDREWLRFLKKNRDLENEIMKDVPGWKTGTWYGEPVYFTLGDKWWDPSIIEAYAHSATSDMNTETFWKHHSEYAAPKFYDKYLPKWLLHYLW
uniref:NADH dehydrogenase [ubiquinone] 1 alpha subcomplex subunit 13 n=1 Tax=Strongyloides venezuelensis TaxID=75913 RepID=A0A0K0F8X8_STRVS